MSTSRTTCTTRASALAAAAVLVLTSCKPEGSSSQPPAAPSGQTPPAVTSPAIAELLAAVPGNAIALAFIDLNDPPWSRLTGGAMLPLDEATRKALDIELRDYVARYLGLDLSKLQYAVGFVSGPPPRGAVLLKSVGGEPKMPGASDYEGGKLWVVDPEVRLSLAIKGDLVVFGKDDAVHEVLDTLAGKRKAVTVDNKPLVDWLRNDSNGAVFAFAAIAPKDLRLPPQISGLERFAIRIAASGISAVVDGNEATISALQALADQGLTTLLAGVEQGRQAALAGQTPPIEGAIAIVGAAYAKSYATKLKPRRDGNRLSVSIDLGLTAANAGVAVGVIGVLAAVAIPSFVEYKNKAKALPANEPQ